MEEKSFSEQIDNIINTQDPWKSEIISQIRTIIIDQNPEIVEQVKWKMKTRPEGLPVWSYNGIVCFIEIWKNNVKLLFPKGVYLKDPHKLFNARLKSKDIRAIEFLEGSAVSKQNLQVLIREAIQQNNAN